MYPGSPSSSRQCCLATTVAAGAFCFALLAVPCHAQTGSAADTHAARPLTTETTMAGLDTVPNTAAPAIRPFRVSIPESRLQTSAGAWRRRGGSSGRRSPTKPVQRAKLQPLMDYWSTDYDWRKAEAKLNPLPQFVTEIDGLDMISGPKRGSGEWTVRPILTPAWERS